MKCKFCNYPHTAKDKTGEIGEICSPCTSIIESLAAVKQALSEFIPPNGCYPRILTINSISIQRADDESNPVKHNVHI